MLMHATINGLVLTIGHNQDVLSAGPDAVKIEHVPLQWHALALVGIVVGIALILLSTRGASDADVSLRQSSNDS
jgi:hypothetical protein